MADRTPDHRIQILSAPHSLNRRLQAPRFPPPPQRNNVAHAAMLKGGIERLQQAVQAMSPEQRRAVYLKLVTTNPLSEDELRRLSFIPVRQEGKTVTVALQVDQELSELNRKLTAYGRPAERPPHASVIANLEVAPATLSIEDRTSEAFRLQRAELERAPFSIIQVELSPLLVGAGQLQDLRAGAEQAFERLRSAVQRNGAVYDHLWSADSLSVTVSVGIPGTLVREICTSPNWSFVTWIDVPPDFRTVIQQLQDFDVTEKRVHPPRDSAPLVCVIDSGVLEGNALIRPACRNGYSHSFNSECLNSTTDEHNHGTGVSGIALYRDIGGRLQEVDFQPVAWLANARILNGQGKLGQGQLFGSVLNRAIRHFHGLGCRIFNISVNDISRPYSVRTPLEVAEVLDGLARELDVLIIVSAGNLAKQTIQDAQQNGDAYPAYMVSDGARILDPAQAVCVLTVGSIAGNHLCINPNRRPIAHTHQPSPFTRCGPGVNDYLKPELVDDGGNLTVDPGLGIVIEDPGCQVVTTCNDVGRLLHREVGTSFAAPRVSHLGARVLEVLGAIRTGQGQPFVPTANLLRALIVNSAVVSDHAINLFNTETGRAKRRWIQLCGYGQPDFDRAVTVSPSRSIMVFQGDVELDKIMYFEIPVPEELRVTRRQCVKRLRVTVAYDPLVRRTRTLQYCGTRMSWRLFRGDTPKQEIYDAMSVDEDGNVVAGAEAPNEMSGLFKYQVRSKSTVQHDVFEWKVHRESFSTHPYTLAIVARRNWDTATQRQRFAVAVSLECESEGLDVANLVAERLAVPVPVRVRAR